MEKLITISAAWDKRNPDPKKNYGVHGCELRMVLKGELGATQFVLFTGWMLPHVREEFKNKGPELLYPMPADVGYHSPKPLYEGQAMVGDSCEYLDGKPCYYNGSGLRAESAFDILVEGGSDALWGFLEEEYIDRFGELR